MKKLRVLSILFSIMFIGTSFIACAGGADDELDEEVPATAAEEAAADTSSTRQQQIDNAAAGSTVTLNTSFTDTSITITKALTVNGNGISGLTVTVNSNVTSNVTLKNFVRANIIVKPVSTTNNNIRNISGIRSARSAIVTQPYYSTNSSAGSSNEGFEKMGDNALPLKLEDCEIAKFDAEADVALYMESGDGKKSVIDEINLKSGVEEFTFIEMDKADKPETSANEATATDKKSNVGELNIEGNGIEKINLIGGTFDDVNLANGFTGDAIDFKYDKEFNDQFGNFSDKDAFFGNSKIEEKDVGVAEKTAANGNVYSFQMSKDNFLAMNGFLTIFFMTPEQKAWMDQHDGSVTAIGPRQSEIFMDIISCATMENPIYMMMPTGLFTVEDPENATGLNTIYGSEYAYADYAHAIARGVIGYYENEDVVVLDKYRNYNKEAIIANFEGDYVTIYVNTAAIRKEDVILGNGVHNSDLEQKTEIGTKISEINLDGYIPYLAVDFGETWENLPNGGTNHDSVLIRLNMNTNSDEGRAQVNQFKASFGTKCCSIDNPAIIYGNTLKMSREMNCDLFVMTANASYPNVSGIEYSSVSTPDVKVNPFLSE